MSDPRYTDQPYTDPRYSNLWNHNSVPRSEGAEGGWVLGVSVIALIAIVFAASIYFKPEGNAAKTNPTPITESRPMSKSTNRPDSASTQPLATLPRR